MFLSSSSSSYPRYFDDKMTTRSHWNYLFLLVAESESYSISSSVSVLTSCDDANGFLFDVAITSRTYKRLFIEKSIYNVYLLFLDLFYEGEGGRKKKKGGHIMMTMEKKQKWHIFLIDYRR